MKGAGSRKKGGGKGEREGGRWRVGEKVATFPTLRERTREAVGVRAFVQAAGHADMRERLWVVIVFMIVVII